MRYVNERLHNKTDWVTQLEPQLRLAANFSHQTA